MGLQSKTRALFAILAFLTALLALPAATLLFNEDVILLRPSRGAEWIGPDLPFSMDAFKAVPQRAAYRTVYNASPGQESAVLEVSARTAVAVYIDGEEAQGATGAWERPVRVDLAPYGAGSHDLLIMVENVSGIPVLLARSAPPGIRTGEGWEASTDMVSWSGARPLSAAEYALESRQFRAAYDVFLSELPFLAPVFLAAFAWTIICSRKESALSRRLTPGPRLVSLVIMAGLAGLAANNFWKLPPMVGFDQIDHLEYIMFVAMEGTLPLAGDGFVMYHSPLYYMKSALVYLAFDGIVLEETLHRILRLVPAASGILMVEAIYRAAKNAFPERGDLQSLAVVIGGLLPMNIYLSRGLGNEMLSALFSSCTIAAGLWILRSPLDKKILAKITLMGVFFGLALLSKVTAVLLAPFVAAVVVIKCVFAVRAGERFKKAALAMSLSFGAAFIISGWYYIRNMIHLGKPFAGNWEPGAADWWQFPSYRVLEHLYRFGESLVYPGFSIGSFWDSFYSTMWMDGFFSGVPDPALNYWNHDLMLSGPWLAILPSLGIVIGIAASLKYREAANAGLLLLALCVALYFGALIDFYLKVPFYSAAKATYTSGITVCYALLGALGLGALSRWLWVRAVVNGWISSWAVYAYGAYFILE